MSDRQARPLAAGYSSESDGIDERLWYEHLQQFEDASLYQTWAYGEVVEGRRNMAHFVLKRNGHVVAIAQARIKRMPVFGLGIGYVRWGPVWRRAGMEADLEIYRQALRGLRNEFVCKRGLSLRLFPFAFEDDLSDIGAILETEGFSSLGGEERERTILMDLEPPLADLKTGMNSHWKKSLKVADKHNLELLEGRSGSLFDRFIGIYKEVVSRKKFVEFIDIQQYKQIQERLPEEIKMNILLCQSGVDLCAGVVYSLLGKTAVCLFCATSDSGTKSRGSYLLQWKIIEILKDRGAAIYDLNGINPARNPGTYRFKRDLAGKHGREVVFLGKFDATAGSVGHSLIRVGDLLKTERKRLQRKIAAFQVTARKTENQDENRPG
jgi:lipid II:glycine glycyltransferase (peptidoglycan interpeptide bridge formation enzyme)